MSADAPPTANQVAPKPTYAAPAPAAAAGAPAQVDNGAHLNNHKFYPVSLVSFLQMVINLGE